MRNVNRRGARPPPLNIARLTAIASDACRLQPAATDRGCRPTSSCTGTCFPVWREALLQSISRRPETFAHAAGAVHLFPDAAA